MFPISSTQVWERPDRFVQGGKSKREALGICKRAARQAPSVYFSAASFEEAMLATSVLGLSFCNCS